MISLFYKLLKKITHTIFGVFETLLSHLLLVLNNVKYSRISVTGIPYVMVSRGGKMIIGKNFSMHNGIKGSPLGVYRRCTFFISPGATLKIGDDVGISQTALICHTEIAIGNRVKIGGGVSIYDTDFHSLDPKIRAGKDDFKMKKKAPVSIEDDVFIGYI